MADNHKGKAVGFVRTILKEKPVFTMNMFGSLLVLLNVMSVARVAVAIEPRCLSRFDHDYKVMQKLFELDAEIQKLKQEQENKGELPYRYFIVYLLFFCLACA